MLDVVNISRAGSGASGQPLSKVAEATVSDRANGRASQQALAYTSSAIRVDNLQNVAILEYRSAETGEVKNQYPNQRQIEAFRAAKRIQEQNSVRNKAAAEQTSAPKQHVDISVNGFSSAKSASYSPPAPTSVAPSSTVTGGDSVAASISSESSSPVLA